MDAEIPQEVPIDPYYYRRIRELRTEIAEIEALSEDEATARVNAKAQETRREWQARQAETQRLQAEYKRLIAQIEAWPPPTPDHQGLKDFALQQLRESLEFDVHGWEEPAAPVVGWKERTLAELHKSLAQAWEDLAKQIQWTKDANAWLTALRASLPE